MTSTSHLLIRTAQWVECSLCSRLCPNNCMSMIYLVLTTTTEKVLLDNWSVEVLSPSVQTAQLLGYRAGIWVRGNLTSDSPPSPPLHTGLAARRLSASQDWHTRQVMSHTWFFSLFPSPHFPSFTFSPLLLFPSVFIFDLNSLFCLFCSFVLLWPTGTEY